MAHMKVAQVIKDRRMAMGLSQAELGAKAGMEPRQIRRYEAGDAQPSLTGAKALADALNITLDELVGDEQLDLSGAWWSAWQGVEADYQLQQVLLLHRGRKVEINTPPAPPGETNALPWHGELTLLETEAFGWYVLEHSHRGVISLKLDTDSLLGYWVTAKRLRPGPSGYLALARTGSIAQQLVEDARRKSRTRWDDSDSAASPLA